MVLPFVVKSTNGLFVISFFHTSKKDATTILNTKPTTVLKIKYIYIT